MDQGIDVAGVAFETPFFSAHKAEMAAQAIGMPFTAINITDAHLQMLKSPHYGFGKNMNPCIDCHTLMLNIAGQRMEQTGADFLLTGEVLGQRPMSQTHQSLRIVAKNSGYGDFILRPLSAQLLAETRPEREGKVDRTRLLAIQGRGRKIQIDMARRYGITDYPPPAGGCLLTDINFSKRLRDLFHNVSDYRTRDIELLKYGRHFRFDRRWKAIVGRNEADNQAIQGLIEETDSVIQMADIAGPTVIVPYGGNDEVVRLSAGLCARYSGALKDGTAQAIIKTGAAVRTLAVQPLSEEEVTGWLL